MVRYICVYCGSSETQPSGHQQVAATLGRAIVTSGFSLLYGGANVGLMGIVADSVLASGGEILGVITPEIQEMAAVHPALTHKQIVHSYAEGKIRMRDQASAFMALPGGFGTLDEIGEILIMNQLARGIHQQPAPTRPVALVNIEGFFDPLIAQFDRCVEAGYMKPEYREMVFASSDVTLLMDYIKKGI